MTMGDGSIENRDGSQTTCYLFWPSEYPLDSTGYLVGWRQQGMYCVASLATSSQETVAWLNVRLSQTSGQLTNARVLGQISPVDSSLLSTSTEHQDDSWITLTYREGELQLAGSSKLQGLIVVTYDRPAMRKHHFLSLTPLLKPSLLSSHLPFAKTTMRSSIENKNHTLVHKIKSFEENWPQHGLSSLQQHKEMTELIDFINSSEELDHQVHRSSPSTPLQTNQKTVTPNPHHPLHHSPPSALVSILALSTFLQQLHVRLVELSSWPSRYRKITQETSSDLPGRRAEYVMLFNTLWLISNDVIFGRASGTILMTNSQLISDWLEYHLTTYTVTFVKNALVWTNSYPVGLKLNDQLGQAFCNLATLAIDFWHNYVLKYAFSSLPQLICTLGVFSLFGNTFTLALASDFLSIATFHLWIIYRLFTLIFNRQLIFLSVLYNIFRGKKYNELRKRIEPATYQLDQLILGTILFTLVIFLFPTILAFYVLMSLTRVLIIWIHGIISTGLSLLNQFPLFIVMLRLKDPARLPAGVAFVPSIHQEGIHFKLENVPVGLRWIFSDYISLYLNLTSHYSPQRLIYNLCLGKPIAPLSSTTSRFYARS